MKKKIVALLCTVAMTCTLLAGCGQSAADTTAGTFETEDSTEVETDAVSDQEAANNVAALIDAIYVQERTDKTDAQGRRQLSKNLQRASRSATLICGCSIWCCTWTRPRPTSM